MVILDGIADAVVKLDGQANYMAMNQAAIDTFRQLGRDPETMMGKSVWEVFPELKGTFVEKALSQAFEDKVAIRYEFQYAGNQHWYETQGYPASPGIILVFRDITDRKIPRTAP
jgi:PAS domain S-box-containing protein